MKQKIILAIIISSIINNFYAQTIGLLLNEPGTSDGYILFTPEKSKNTYLINNCGEIINSWQFNEAPGLTCYLLENGNILRAGQDSIQIRDWSNNVVWSFAMNTNNLPQHHDIEPLPNGNILCVVAERFTQSEIIELGRDPSITALNFRIDKVVELQPVGINEANIVWEWKFSDHLIQDFDETKQNFGIVEDHPELIDINYDNGYDNDWTHVNSVDYNSELDQIIISVRHLSEIIILDHSTTSIEVSGHTGGNSNMGGDIIFRWGNPQVYRQGDESSQKLFEQHDARWIETGFQDAGKISVFNNGGDGSGLYSSIHIIEPEIAEFTYQMQNNIFLPQDYFWSWHEFVFEETVNEVIKSSAQFQENGNVIFTEYSKCRINEISRNGDLLWSYVNPVGQEVLEQGDIVDATQHGIFRGERYSPDFPGFVGKELTPQGILENENTISNLCISTEINSYNNRNISVYPNPANNVITVANAENSNIVVLNMVGEVVASIENASANQTIDISNVASGAYFVRVNSEVFKVNVVK